MVRMVRSNGTHCTLGRYALRQFCAGKGAGVVHMVCIYGGGCGARVDGICSSMDVSNVKVNEEHYGTGDMVYGIQ